MYFTVSFQATNTNLWEKKKRWLKEGGGGGGGGSDKYLLKEKARLTESRPSKYNFKSNNLGFLKKRARGEGVLPGRVV